MNLLNSESSIIVKKEDVEKVVKENSILSLTTEEVVNYAIHRQVEDLETARKILLQTYIQAELVYNDATLLTKVKNPARTLNEILQTKLSVAEKLISLSNATDKLKPKQEKTATPVININITTQKTVEDFIEVEVEE
jgi:hypothetical protein